jgi:hypothetical protein
VTPTEQAADNIATHAAKPDHSDLHDDVPPSEYFSLWYSRHRHAQQRSQKSR